VRIICEEWYDCFALLTLVRCQQQYHKILNLHRDHSGKREHTVIGGRCIKEGGWGCGGGGCGG
jgi:hypothetical protein